MFYKNNIWPLKYIIKSYQIWIDMSFAASQTHLYALQISWCLDMSY